MKQNRVPQCCRPKKTFSGGDGISTVMTQRGLASHPKTTIPGLVLVFVLWLGLSAQAATVTWTGGGSDNFASNPVNWSAVVGPQDDDSIIFDNTSVKDCTWDAYLIPASLRLNQGYTGTVTSNSALAISNNLTVSGGNLRIANNLKIGSSGGVVTPSTPTGLAAVTASATAISLS